MEMEKTVNKKVMNLTNVTFPMEYICNVIMEVINIFIWAVVESDQLAWWFYTKGVLKLNSLLSAVS